MSPAKILSITVAGLLLAGCGNLPPNFSTMSEEELHAYNMQQPLLQQVICVKEQTTSSFIRKRRCQTLMQIYNARSNAAMALNVLNYGTNYNAGISRGYD